MSASVIDVVLKELREKKVQLVSAVARGDAKDFAEYKGICGELRGLSAVEQYLMDLALRMEQYDD